MIHHRLENLLSFACKWVLILMPVLFVIGHVAADGEISNYATGWRFDPIFDLVSSYAWRSPAGWAIVACMMGFSFVLGFISWHASKRGPGFLAWFTAVVAAVAMVRMLDVAWYPMMPSQDVFGRIQREIEKAPIEKKADAVCRIARNITGADGGWRTNSPEYLKSLRSYWLHDQGNFDVQRLILVTMAGALFLWRRPQAGPDLWLRANWGALIWIAIGVVGSAVVPGYGGLFQRVAFFGVYLWMWIIFREIQRVRREAAADHGDEGVELNPLEIERTEAQALSEDHSNFYLSNNP